MTNIKYVFGLKTDEDIIPVKLDRIDEVKITIMTRKGDLINFVDHHDVKCQLEFKQIV